MLSSLVYFQGCNGTLVLTSDFYLNHFEEQSEKVHQATSRKVTGYRHLNRGNDCSTLSLFWLVPKLNQRLIPYWRTRKGSFPSRTKHLTFVSDVKTGKECILQNNMPTSFTTIPSDFWPVLFCYKAAYIFHKIEHCQLFQNLVSTQICGYQYLSQHLRHKFNVTNLL